jgi:hypothetical protein
MNSIFDIASKVATPLALAGLFGAILFFTLRRILQAHFVSQVGKNQSAQILLRIINYLFILCLVGMILGFAGYVLRFSRPENNKSKTKAEQIVELEIEIHKLQGELTKIDTVIQFKQADSTNRMNIRRRLREEIDKADKEGRTADAARFRKQMELLAPSAITAITADEALQQRNLQFAISRKQELLTQLQLSQ